MADERLNPASTETHESDEKVATIDMEEAEKMFGNVYTRVLADFKRSQGQYNMYHSTGDSPSDRELRRDLEASQRTKNIVEELANGLQINLNQENS